MNIPLTTIRFLRYAEQQFPRKTAIVCGDQRFTYAQFAERARRLAGVLLEAGVQPGDRLLVWQPIREAERVVHVVDVAERDAEIALDRLRVQRHHIHDQIARPGREPIADGKQMPDERVFLLLPG